MLLTHPAVTIILSLALSIFVLPAHAEESNKKKSDHPFGRLQSHEPNLLGYAHDDNDVDYMDFKVSLKYPMFHDGVYTPPIWGWLPHAYLAFTGRFSQYISTRDSSPVISKRFNPELFGRYWLSADGDTNGDYFDIAYGHESNGQSIDTSAAYLDKRNSLIAAGEDANFANDYISRGWDYVGATWKFTRRAPFSTRSRITGYLGLRYFLNDGALQGKQEEYNIWENNPEGKRRKSVDGVRLKLKYDTNFINNKIFKSNKLFFSITTGFDDMFKYNTYRAEWAVGIKNVPIMIWASRGYNSDLVDYYKKVTSFGIAMELVSY